MSIPASENKHRILKYNCRVTKSIERLDSVALYFFPLVLFIFNAAFVHVTKSLFAIVASVNEEATIPKNHSMICSLTWSLTRLKSTHIKPFSLYQVVVKQILIKVSTFLLIATKKVKFIIKVHTLCTRSGQRNFSFTW